MDDTQARNRLLERLGQASERTIPKAPDGPTPLSFAQERLWLLQQLNPHDAAAVRATGLRLIGPLDVRALRWSLDEIIRRHEILRTVYLEQNGQIVQIVQPARPIDLEFHDISRLDSEAQQEQINLVATQRAHLVLDLTNGPLGVASLLEIGPEEHVLLFLIHHIAFDGWSEGVFIRELAALYDRFLLNTPALPELTLQFRDYAAWQRERFDQEESARDLTYWTDKLAGMLDALPLPTDASATSGSLHRRSQHRFTLDQTLVRQIEAFANERGYSTFMVLLAVFKILLYRYSLHEDIVTGTVAAARNPAETEKLIGGFATLVALRTDLSGNPTFLDVLDRVKETALGAFSHQQTPLQHLIAALHPQRRLTDTPLFQVLFEFRNLPDSAARTQTGLSIRRERISMNVGTWALIFDIEPGEDGFDAVIEYATDRYLVDTIARMSRYYETLLRSALAAPEQPINSLALITAAERRQLVELGSERQIESDRHSCIHQMFEQQVARTPDRIALTAGGSAMHYDDLNRKANQLAHRLIAEGVVAETPVAVFLERSENLIVAFLGILKAGGVYVPIDATTPTDRLDFMLSDSGAALVVADKATALALPSKHPKTINLATDASLPDAPAHNPGISVAPENAAYIIYTSGSTGQPKGVVVEHRNVVRLFTATDQWFNFSPTDVWTLFHSPAFDFSVWEMWGALLYGGRLVIVPSDIARSADSFHALLQAEQVTILSQTPSAFNTLMWADAQHPPDALSALRLIIFGGEALEFARLQPWFERHDDSQPQLVNMYGITETTVHVTYRPVHKNDADSPAGSLIGQCIPDLSLHILDPGLEPAPVGIPGEIYVGGAGVARGYLNRPDLTDERFVANPFGVSSDARLYRSGDLAKRTASGDIVYLGRSDQQVKIRGYRIETGEVEAALRDQAGVKDAIVTLAEFADDDQRLVAYVAITPPNQLDAQSLRKSLADWLPDYMIPATIILLDNLPLTANGKLDRKALPEPAANQPLPGPARIAPRTATERFLAQVWQELLGTDDFGVNDNFFDLGGHSLHLMRMANLIYNEYNVRLPLRIIFDANTIDALSLAILERQVLQSDQDEVTAMIGRLNQMSPEEIMRLLEEQ
ncbi:MAG: amino acid adenylation domain-containing protein [Caldilineales bacterium]|nr:amino acid adenylation domain-containing protein [Caldilineales bacterium]